LRLRVHHHCIVPQGTCQRLEKSYFRLTSAPDPAEVRPESVLGAALDRLLRLIRAGQEKYLYLLDQFKVRALGLCACVFVMDFLHGVAHHDRSHDCLLLVCALSIPNQLGMLVKGRHGNMGTTPLALLNPAACWWPTAPSDAHTLL
jgi:hypothetical protein